MLNIKYFSAYYNLVVLYSIDDRMLAYFSWGTPITATSCTPSIVLSRSSSSAGATWNQKRAKMYKTNMQICKEKKFTLITERTTHTPGILSLWLILLDGQRWKNIHPRRSILCLQYAAIHFLLFLRLLFHCLYNPSLPSKYKWDDIKSPWPQLM